MKFAGWNFILSTRLRKNGLSDPDGPAKNVAPPFVVGSLSPCGNHNLGIDFPFYLELRFLTASFFPVSAARKYHRRSFHGIESCVISVRNLSDT